MDNFESVLLKNIIESKDFFNKVRPILKPSTFTDFGNQKIYELIDNFYSNYNTTPSIQEIALQIKDIPNKEARNQIATKLNDARNAENINNEFLDDLTVKFIKDQMFTKALILGAEFIDKKDETYKQKAKDLIDASQLVNIHKDLGNEYNNIEERIDYYQNPKKGIKYLRFNTLNEYIGEGFLNGTLNIFMAPAGIGKSLLMSTSIGDFLKQGLNVLLVSLELSNFEFLKRIDADLLDIQINALKDVDPSVIRTKFEELKRSGIGKLYVQNFPAGSFSSNDLKSLLEMYKANNIKFDAIFLDYLGLMKSDRVSANAGLYSYIKAIGEEVRAVAVTENIPIFSCSQLNRSAVNNTDSNNEAISDSMGTAMTADWICFLLQTEDLKKKNTIRFKITKNRYNGRTSSFDMHINYMNMRIEDLATPTQAINAPVEVPKLTDKTKIDWNFN